MFCSSVFFCEKKNNCETRWRGFSLTERTEFTELLAHSLSPQNTFGIQSSQSVTAEGWVKIGKEENL